LAGARRNFIMAINPSVHGAFTGKIDTTDPTGYPYGKAQNITAPGDGTGTPWVEDGINDIFGFQQALLDAGSVTPSGTADKVGASDYLDALNAIITDAVDAKALADQQARYPVGEILVSLRTANPSTWIGFGTWVEVGQGRAMMGYDNTATDADFTTLEVPSPDIGKKEVILDVTQLPAHDHQLNDVKNSDAGADDPLAAINNGATTQNRRTGMTGGGLGHNNLPPYYVVVIWKRTL
jgi:hypothetical protein